jgi:hypothetical protein
MSQKVIQDIGTLGYVKFHVMLAILTGLNNRINDTDDFSLSFRRPLWGIHIQAVKCWEYKLIAFAYLPDLADFNNITPESGKKGIVAVAFNPHFNLCTPNIFPVIILPASVIITSLKYISLGLAAALSWKQAIFIRISTILLLSNLGLDQLIPALSSAALIADIACRTH